MSIMIDNPNNKVINNMNIHTYKLLLNHNWECCNCRNNISNDFFVYKEKIFCSEKCINI